MLDVSRSHNFALLRQFHFRVFPFDSVMSAVRMVSFSYFRFVSSLPDENVFGLSTAPGA